MAPARPAQTPVGNRADSQSFPPHCCPDHAETGNHHRPRHAFGHGRRDDLEVLQLVGIEHGVGIVEYSSKYSYRVNIFFSASITVAKLGRASIALV